MGAPTQWAGCCSKAGREATLNTWLEWLLGFSSLHFHGMFVFIGIPQAFGPEIYQIPSFFGLYLVWPWDNDQDV